MKKRDLKFMPEFFDRYINLVSDEETILEALENSKNDLLALKDQLEKHKDYSYKTGKWTPKDLIQHIIDTERILAYRALVYARNDTAELPGFDENLYANNSKGSDRSVDDLLQEFTMVRASNISLFRNFSEEALHSEGICFHKKMTTLALGFVIVGHPKHHIKILKERYFK